MRTLISNLNVIRATRVSGFLCNGIDGVSTRIAMLTERIADTAWRALAAGHEDRLHEKHFHAGSREMFWKPLYASAGSSPAGMRCEKRSRFLQEMDQTCPALSRLWGQPRVLQLAAITMSTTTPSRPATATGNGFNPAG